MAASVWSGHLTFGLISMPVRLFSGARSSGISFNMLHRTDKSRLKQQYICQAEGVVVDRADMVKGYEFRKDEYIIIEPEEIKKIEPQTAKTMEILEFVKAGDVDPVYFESSYYMMPEEAGRRPYALLTKALEESDRNLTFILVPVYGVRSGQLIRPVFNFYPVFCFYRFPCKPIVF